MFWADRTNRVTGVILILLALGIILTFVLSFGQGESDPFDRSEIDDFLKDIKDNETSFVLMTAVDIVIDAAIGIAAAAALYVLFRERNRLLAVSGLVFILAAQVTFIVIDATDVALLALATDFKEGGPAGIGAGDSVILEVARAVAIFQGTAQGIGFTALSLGFLAFGALIARAPATGVVPPRWLGWLAMLAGVVGILGWLVVLSDALFVLFIIFLLAALVWLLILGVWLLRQGDGEPARAAA